MGLILSLFGSAITGFVSHLAWKPSREFGKVHGLRWGSKIRHAVGILTIAPPLAFVMDNLEMPNSKTKTIIAVLVTALAYGGGNFLAHALDKK